MSDRAALITGGSSGIGLAIARCLGTDGYRVTIAARRPKRLAAAVKALEADGVTAESVAADVAVEEDVARLLAHQREAHGRLDVLVNNAATGFMRSIDRTSARPLDRTVAVNVRGVVLCTREAIPMLRESGAEHGKALVANVASLGGKDGQADIAVYAATKAAVLSFSRSTQRELGGDGIQCTALAPGLVDTPMADYARDWMRGEDMIRPEDVGEGIRFLLRTSERCHVPEIVFGHPEGRTRGPA